MPFSLSKTVFGLLTAGAMLLAGQAAAATLSGEITYRERIALPPGASLTVKLIDLSDENGTTRVEANAAIASPGQVPLTFNLNFDERIVAAGRSYGLVAEIVVGTDLWFRNFEPYRLAPLSPEAPIVIIVNFAGRTAQPATAPAGEGTPAGGSILKATWRATEIRGEPAIAHSEPTLSIGDDMRAGGRGGCNSYFAQASISGASIRFSAAGATRMACLSEAVMRQESTYFEMLTAVRSWRVTGNELELLGEGGVTLARFARAAR